MPELGAAKYGGDMFDCPSFLRLFDNSRIGGGDCRVPSEPGQVR